MSDTTTLGPVLIYAAAVAVAIVGMMVLSWLLGGRHYSRGRGVPYESGILPTGSARLRLSIKFYLIAMFFVIFDLEAVFIVTWAIALRPAGWLGYAEMVVFIGVLVAALAYLWRDGALDWGTPR